MPEVLSSVAARLARLDRELTDPDRQRIANASGGYSLKDLARGIVEALDPDLAAAHPELHDVGVADAAALELQAAIAILDAARTLAQAINRYRVALVHAEQRDELLPF